MGSKRDARRTYRSVRFQESMMLRPVPSPIDAVELFPRRPSAPDPQQRIFSSAPPFHDRRKGPIAQPAIAAVAPTTESSGSDRGAHVERTHRKRRNKRGSVELNESPPQHELPPAIRRGVRKAAGLLRAGGRHRRCPEQECKAPDSAPEPKPVSDGRAGSPSTSHPYLPERASCRTQRAPASGVFLSDRAVRMRATQSSCEPFWIGPRPWHAIFPLAEHQTILLSATT